MVHYGPGHRQKPTPGSARASRRRPWLPRSLRLPSPRASSCPVHSLQKKRNMRGSRGGIQTQCCVSPTVTRDLQMFSGAAQVKKGKRREEKRAPSRGSLTRLNQRFSRDRERRSLRANLILRLVPGLVEVYLQARQLPNRVVYVRALLQDSGHFLRARVGKETQRRVKKAAAAGLKRCLATVPSRRNKRNTSGSFK